MKDVEVSDAVRQARHEVAQIILRQLGGGSRLRAMLGARIGFMALTTGAECGNGGLVVNQIPARSMGGKMDAFRVTLQADDTYRVDVFQTPSRRAQMAAFARGEDELQCHPAQTVEGIYADCLVETIEEMTGYALRLAAPRMGGL